ncbi:MAG: enoyl-CoA hydratase/isomerase family protein [Chitinophagales bacterium]|nr:enoyl-CoA hydratase/isomerase family protein [Chitinophagales bacterium]
MNFSLIKTEQHDRLYYITLSRAEKKNALNSLLVTELTAALQIAENEAAVKIVILKAEGDVFSAGADLEYLQQLQHFSYEENLADSSLLKTLLLKIHTLKKIVIAQVEGHAIAGGCGLAAVCDFCFAVPEAKFGYTEVKIGFIPALVMVFLLRKISGVKTRELLYTGKLISADEAVDYGLINMVVAKDEIAGYVKAFATRLSEESSAQSLAATKEMLTKVPGMELHEALQYAAEMNATTRSSDDCKKGVGAFLSREKFKW